MTLTPSSHVSSTITEQSKPLHVHTTAESTKSDSTEATAELTKSATIEATTTSNLNTAAITSEHAESTTEFSSLTRKQT